MVVMPNTPAPCVCGQTYDEFKTGLTFGDVRQMMYIASENSEEWRQKRRRSILGFWHEIKIQLFHTQHGHCDTIEEFTALSADSIAFRTGIGSLRHE